jgi:hypothetical protein
MRRGACAIAGLLAGVLASASSTGRERSSADTLLAPGRAGAIELGMPVDEIYRRFGKDNVRLIAQFPEGMFTPALEIVLPDAKVTPALVVRIREAPCYQQAVWGIDVRDPSFRTADGLGVGSPAADLYRRYPFRIGREEGSYAAPIEPLRMSFSLTRDEPVERAVVTSIWIWPDPAQVRARRCPAR